jgi:hypothetical protein
VGSGVAVTVFVGRAVWVGARVGKSAVAVDEILIGEATLVCPEHAARRKTNSKANAKDHLFIYFLH